MGNREITSDEYNEIMKSFDEQRIQMKELEEREQELMDRLSKYAIQQQESRIVMEKAKKTIQKQNKEIQIYKAEIEHYKRIVNKINNTWYGRFALKCYRLLMRR